MNQTSSIPRAHYRLARRLALLTALVTITSTTSLHAAVVVPPEESYAGKTYPEWMAASWISAWAHPTTPTTLIGGPDLRDGSSPVWYLWGVGSPNPTSFHIRIPHDQALFVTFDGVACSTVE